MPEDSKKNQKGKHDTKEQRRKRQPRQQAGAVEKKQEKEPENPKETPKAPEKPAYQPPGPEFYKGLKRETDEILKITEEENSKYRKKEIQSNWAKYEMPIESYEEIDEQEQLGADYETLIQAPLLVGTHFQFKHEKSWDVTSGPSPYEKYFDIDMGNLVVALSTIPFYERNSIDKSIFTESDYQSMDHRASKFKQKYYNDNKYNTPDLEAQNNIINKLCDKNEKRMTVKENIEPIEKHDQINNDDLLRFNMNLEDNNHPVVNEIQNPTLELNMDNNKEAISTMKDVGMDDVKTETKSLNESNIDNPNPTNETQEIEIKELGANHNFDENLLVSDEPELTKIEVPVTTLPEESPQVSSELQKEPKNPIIESPEDLEKWLDDFLDG